MAVKPVIWKMGRLWVCGLAKSADAVHGFGETPQDSWAHWIFAKTILQRRYGR